MHFIKISSNIGLKVEKSRRTIKQWEFLQISLRWPTASNFLLENG